MTSSIPSDHHRAWSEMWGAALGAVVGFAGWFAVLPIVLPDMCDLRTNAGCSVGDTFLPMMLAPAIAGPAGFIGCWLAARPFGVRHARSVFVSLLVTGPILALGAFGLLINSPLAGLLTSTSVPLLARTMIFGFAIISIASLLGGLGHVLATEWQRGRSSDPGSSPSISPTR